MSITWLTKILLQLSIVLYVGGDALLGRGPERWWTLDLFWLAPCMALPALSNWLHYRAFCDENASACCPETLKTDFGLLRWVRHPMYLGDLAMVTGFLIFWPNAITLLLAGCFYAAIFRLAQIEDDKLAQQFGTQHQAWAEITYRLIPGVW